MTNNIIPALILSSLAGFSTCLGSLIAFIKIKEVNYSRFISFCLAFSGAVMISISIFDLIPEAYKVLKYSYSFTHIIFLIIIFLISSYFIITMLNKKIPCTNDLYRLGILNMIILILHNFPEGIATFLTSYHNISLGLKISIAILLHNIPEGISIAVPIIYSTKSFKKAFTATLISGLSEPIGAIVAFIFLRKYITIIKISIILLVVAGLMITLAIESIIPKASEYHHQKELYIGFSLGIVIVLINILFF